MVAPTSLLIYLSMVGKVNSMSSPHNCKRRAFNKDRASDNPINGDMFEEICDPVHCEFGKAYCCCVKEKCLQSTKQFENFILPLKKLFK